jgi:cysteine synthase A
MAGYSESVVELIGQTPMVRLTRALEVEGAPPVVAAKVLAKLEFQNPGGSVKDRIAAYMIEAAEARGEITPGRTTIIEATSGNTGIGLAMVCAAKGYRCIICVPQMASMTERYLICRKFGAHMHLIAPAVGITGMLRYVQQQMATHPDYWSPMQFENDDNRKTHELATGPEIWAQTGGDVDFFIAGAGTAGTVAGVGGYLKSQNAACKIMVVEPAESRVLVGETPSPRGHGVVGIGAGVIPPLLDVTAPGAFGADEQPHGVIDLYGCASTAEAVAMADRLAQTEGLLVGPSSGAAVHAALALARSPAAAGKTVVVLLASSGIRYVAHPMWAAERGEADVAFPAKPATAAEPLCLWRSEDGGPPPPEPRL